MELCPKRKKPNLPRNRHFLKLTDFTREELQEIIDLSIILKRAHRQGVELPLLKDKSLAILFSQASTRTRVSFETAMTQLGGHALYISTNSIYHDHNESMLMLATTLRKLQALVPHGASLLSRLCRGHSSLYTVHLSLACRFSTSYLVAYSTMLCP